MPSRLVSIALCAALLAVHGADSATWQSKRKKRYDCSRQLQRAQEKYEKKRYNEVKTLLTETKYQCTGHSAMDSILYYLGMAQMMSRGPSEAKVEFERLITDFPNSPFAEEAQFRMGHSSYLSSNPPERDQSKTKDAIRELSGFIDRYPQSVFADSAHAYLQKCHDRLAEKQFLTARFYQKIDRYEAAIVYYRAIVADFPESKFAVESKLSLAHCLARVRRPGEAQEVLEKLIDEKPGEDIVRRARNLLSRLTEIGREGKHRWRLFDRLRGKPAEEEGAPQETPDEEQKPQADDVQPLDRSGPDDLGQEPAEDVFDESAPQETQQAGEEPERKQTPGETDEAPTQSPRAPEGHGTRDSQADSLSN